MTETSRKVSEKSKGKASNLKGQQHSNEKHQLVTPQPECTDPKAIPFPEWANDDIVATHSSTQITGKAKSEKSEKDKVDKHDDFRSFEDPQVLFLPFCLQDEECDWKRARNIFSEYELVIFNKTNEYPDLLSASSHLVHSPFIRSFISTVTILQYLSNTTHFPTEATTAKFTPNAEGPWKPWHHIYSGGKQTSTHNPTVNQSGKYYVRLFWMGAWRRVTVDDYLPVDKTGHVLLPSLPIPPIRVMSAYTDNTTITTSSRKSPRKKKKSERSASPKYRGATPKVELWPFLLSKALLKLANMTMKKDRDLIHFNLIHSLTGWVMQHVSLAIEGDVSADEMWEICVRCTKLYSWKSVKEESRSPSPEPIQGPKKSAKKKKKKKKKKGPKVLTPKNVEAKNPHSFVVYCKDMRFPKSNAVQEIAPCWGHEIVIDECRDIPLEQPAPNPEYPLWKKFRWMEWAKSNGLIDEPVQLDRTRYVKCVAPFRQFSTLKVNTAESQQMIPKKPEFPLRKSVNVLAKNTGSIVPQISDVTSESDRSHIEDTGTPRSDMGERTKGKRDPSAITVRDPSVWVKFDDLYSNLLAFDVFFKSSQFLHKARVSDLELNEILKTGTRPSKKNAPSQKDTDTWQNVKCARALRTRGNVPLYFFIDSLDTKMLLINMCQSGDVERLVPMEDELSETNFFVEYERLFGNKTKYTTDKPQSPVKPKLNRPRIHMNLKPSYLLFDEYHWSDAKAGKIISFLTTYGNSTTMLELDAGRHIFRLWTKSEFPFCITLLSDSDFSIGTLEQINENMAVEPMQITQFSLDITKAYADLVNSFGTDTYASSLRACYRSYMPKDANTLLTKHQRSLIHDAFQAAFIQYLRQTQNSSMIDKVIDALRTLFLNVSYCIRTEAPPERIFSLLQIHSFQEKIICERASAKLAAFFKYVQVKTLKNRHKVSNPKFNTIFETLKYIYSSVFSKDHRDEHLGIVIRSFFDDPSISDFLCLYDCSKDFRWDVDVRTYTGTAEVNRDFVILCRYMLQSKSSLLLNIKLFCSNPHYALSVIDNDTNEEIYRYTNEIFPSQFVPNNFGYTIIGFAWSKEPENINWKLVIISQRKTKTRFSVEEIKTVMYNLFDNYIPICHSLIGKHTITIRESVVFTLRFSCSYKNLKFNIKLFDPDHNLMMDIFGKEKIILPSVLLKNCGRLHSISSWRSRVSNRSLVSKARQGIVMRSTLSDLVKSNFPRKEQAATRKLREIASEASAIFSNGDAVTYRLEIYVVDDSWPLSLVEWDNVKELRESTYFIKRSKQELYEAILTPTRSTTRSARDFRKNTLRRLESIEKPWYLLQYAFKLNAQASLDKDKSLEDETYELKKSWYSQDPDRYQRSLDLRQKYVAQYGCLCPEEYNVSSKSWESVATVETTTNSNTVEGSSASRQEGDDDNVFRTTKCPRCIEVGIPPFDLTPYWKPTTSSSEGQRYVKTEEDHEADRLNREKMLEEYNESLTKRKNDMEWWIDGCQERTALVTIWYEDCRKVSAEMMNDYYIMRQNYLDKWRASLMPKKKEKTPKKKDKKKKKTKKTMKKKK